MKRLVIVASVLAAASWSSQVFAAPLDEPLHCDRPAHAFIGELEQKGLIDPRPSRVEDNSINAFDPAHDADLTAFGYHVFAIVGFQKDDALFKKGKGKPLADSAYGAVVLGSTDSVEAAVRTAGSKAIVHHVAPFVTAIFCQIDQGRPDNRP
jgi:hypothetical protein